MNMAYTTNPNLPRLRIQAVPCPRTIIDTQWDPARAFLTKLARKFLNKKTATSSEL